MVKLKAFQALRPPSEKVHLVASVPYDVVNTEEARALAAGNPLSLLHVSRPEIDLPPGTDVHADEVYATGARNLETLIRACPLSTDSEDCLFVYRQRMGDHVQTGVVGCCSVDDYDAGIVKKHERTRQDKEDDRTRHIVTLRAQTGPVFLMHRPEAEIDRLVAEAAAGPPLYHFTAPDGVIHTMWRVTGGQALENAFAKLPCSYIADGHHRAASASRARAALRSPGPGAVAADHFLAVLFPSNQLRILPYHRVVKDLNGLTPDGLLQRVAEALGSSVEPLETELPAPPSRGVARMFLAGRWHTLRLPPPAATAEPTAALDVSILMERVLGPVLGIGDPRTDKRIDFVGGIRGTPELEKLVNSGQAAVAFAMFPTTVDELMAVADSGQMMPPKSTWFEPKLRSGLVIHRI